MGKMRPENRAARDVASGNIQLPVYNDMDYVLGWFTVRGMHKDYLARVATEYGYDEDACEEYADAFILEQQRVLWDGVVDILKGREKENG